MTMKLKAILVLVIFLLVLFLSLNAEPVPGSNGEVKIESIIKKVYPSVVKVEARNRITKVATGVVIEKGGYIVTTALISPRDEVIYVTTSEGERLEAKFLGMDSETHLALIQVKDKKLSPLEIKKKEELSPGAWIGVVSISPEKTPAITQGIVSSVSSNKLRLNVWVVQGSSGSPVVDSNGRMVGLLRGIYADDKPVFFEFREREVTGTGYVFSRAVAPSSGMAEAIPVHIVKNVTSEIKEKGRVERGWLGVSISENENGQVEIVDIAEESPAELAKLKRGDIILEFEGKDVTSTSMLANEIRKRKPRENVTLKIERNGKREDVKVRLGELSEKSVREELESKFPGLFPPKVFQPPKRPQTPRSEIFRWNWEKRRYIGVYLEEINKDLSEHFGVKEGRGLLVSRINKDSPAEKAGLRVGDVIIKADGERIERIKELMEIIQDKKKGERIKIEFLRDKKTRNIEVEIEEEERGGLFDFSSKDWESYVDSWGEYNKNVEKLYKEWKDRYSKDYKKAMQMLIKELEEGTQKSREATKKLIKSLKSYKKIKV